MDKKTAEPFDIDSVDTTEIENEALAKALERIKERSAPSHASHYTKHSSHSTHSKGMW